MALIYCNRTFIFPDWKKIVGGVLCLIFFSTPISAQFNNSFKIEKHSLAEENFFDWKAYQQPVSWRYQWYTTKNGFNATIGSISQEQFFFDQELRFMTSLSSDIFVSYHQSREELYRESPLYQEVRFRYGDEYGVSVIGFPAYEKKGNAVGYAFSYGHYYTYCYIKISRLMQNLMYNEKNQDDDKNDTTDEYSRTPTVDQIEIQYRWDNGVLLKANLEKEYKTVLKATDGSEEKRYEGYNYDMTLDWFFDVNRMIGIQYRDDREDRKHLNTKGAQDITTDDQNLRFQYTDIYYFFRPDEKNELTLGYLSSLLKNQINSTTVSDAYDFRLWSAQGYMFWQQYRTENSRMNYGLQGGRYALRKDNKKVLEDDEKGIQLKFTIGIEFFDLGRYRILGNSTWDLDTFLGKQWDGGNVQFQAYF